MPRKSRHANVTRQRVLESACEIFAQKGYRDATVAEICDMAGANIAAVNYHFGDKETLYAEALRHAYCSAAARYPIDGGLPPDASPQQRLRAHVGAHLRRTFSDDESSYFPKIVVKEMAEPTDGLRAVVREVLQPHREHMYGLLRKLLGEEADERTVRLCVFSIISQCYFFGFNTAVRQRHLGTGRMTEERLQELIDHITEFCLAGVSQTRERMNVGPDSTAPSSGAGT